MREPDYILDLSSQARDALSGGSGTPVRVGERAARPWLAMTWRCCSAYSRIYRNRDASAYEGRCPRCQRAVHIPIGEGGTSHRFFEAE